MVHLSKSSQARKKPPSPSDYGRERGKGGGRGRGERCGGGPQTQNSSSPLLRIQS